MQVTEQGTPVASVQASSPHEASRQRETPIEADQLAAADPRLDSGLNVASPMASSPQAASKSVKSRAPKRKYYANLKFKSKKKKTGASDDPDWLSPEARVSQLVSHNALAETSR